VRSGSLSEKKSRPLADIALWHPSRDIKIVPVLVGAISTASEQSFGGLLAPYLADPSTLFVVSSDFCHWGQRFRYTHYHPPASDDPAAGTSLTTSNFARTVTDDSEGGAVWQGIDKLDHLGMERIAFSLAPKSSTSSSSTDKPPSAAHAQFAAYLAQTRNTICGRHPIGVLLGALAALESDVAWSEGGMRCEWVRYEQSSRVHRLSDSSVSYASAYVAIGEV